MADYGHDLLFGTFVTPAAEHAARVVELAQVTEEAGLDLVSVQDHPYQPAFLDAWTLLTAIAARTTRVRVFPNVANLPLRPPAVLARSAASLDIISGGRVELGLGAGAFWDAIGAQGGPRRTPGQAVAALAEGIGVIRALWTPGGEASLEGEHYRLRGAQPGPFPVHDIGIWIGAVAPRMLALTGRLGDGWLPSSPYVPPDRLPESNKIIDEAAEAAGRSPADVRRLYNIVGTFGGRGGGFLQGPPEVWAEQLAELALDQGVSAFILASDGAASIRRFAAEVVPAVRELVAAARAGAPAPRPEPEPQAPATETIRMAAKVPAAPNLGVVPTPDDGTRLSEERVWDESARPTGPAPDPGRRYTRHEQAAGQHLIDVHDHLRAELAQVRDIMEQVLAGAMDPGVARSHINTMTMRQNNWTLGTYCETYCRLVTVHHTLEDQSLFPHLRRADSRLAPVIDRLQAEHHAIHGVIERVDRALVSFVSAPDGAKELRAAVDLLTDTLLSHLSYEERELVEPIARLGMG
ncbi:alkanesulfonate monooxygenase SsuD/methylene tetrahydromethanopterin reductase-like flavin-dependent oxidoreductase (luciferase family) [Thermocatellispora tengchongensis]|uniref:Alkanesulfonate monooxygenase SsuD/methylene tetrahydromethanopterin reductase-like flavin-dependent oxidoreductase (Luciferase family) n=2 Tax=Thermocatellispora tengchongensis TaxID=1073253 RepID=A0A840P4X6_9ACTN|nr:LLM class flavin-dependent oxidoreductase [Thermocatellispora tengchongensis]MBB5134728.1 alkanesulfonate monooxygenase SsuD/methylene tetrahydromethanopterin reductase-like flavin-dependent oxidoreductase (luciferase family) [Thermocatellispora tengchongensis]